MSLPILVHLLFVMKKPTAGSVTAPQAFPMNNTKEAWKALICKDKEGQDGIQSKAPISIYPCMGATQRLKKEEERNTFMHSFNTKGFT